MKNAALSGKGSGGAADASGGARAGHAFPTATSRDAFKPSAARSSQKQDAFAAKKPAQKTSDFFDPFASRPGRPRAARPATVAPAAPPLQLVSSRRVVATPAATDVVEEGRLLRVGGGGTVWVASTAPDPEPARPAVASTTPAPPEPSNDYWSLPAPAPAEPVVAAKSKKKGGGDGGGKGGGDSAKMGATGYRERVFDQDDITGLLIAIALLLLLGWMWLQGRGGLPEEEATLTPQFAAAEPEAPAPAPDPFGPGPVDLRPTSPIPEAVEPEEAAPAAPAAAPVVLPPLEVSANPKTQLASSAVETVEAPRPFQAYFCTSSSSLTPAARVQFDRQVANLKAGGAPKELIVTGFADTRGTTEFNAQLGGLRADFVADLLRTEGFTVIEAVGVGELDDIDDETNCPNQRRVDIAFKGSALSTPTRACAPPAAVQPLACS